MIEDVVAELGVEVTYVSDHEVQGFCPVHELVTGRTQSKPKWYINRETGAWLCFTCGQRGSLPSLVEALGGDPETIAHLQLTATTTRLERLASDDIPEEPHLDLSPESFDANPRPSERVMAIKNVTADVVERYNARWDATGKCWLLPIYTFDNRLIGWQEKSKGYFMNVPVGVKKSHSLFGWHTYRTGPLVVVESPLDAMYLAALGYPAVATYGSFLSDEQIERIATASKVVLAFDNDDAGDHANEQLSSALLEGGHTFVRRFRYPKGSRGKDPGELTPEELAEGYARARLVNQTKENEHGSRTKVGHTKTGRALRQRRQKRSVWRAFG